MIGNYIFKVGLQLTGKRELKRLLKGVDNPRRQQEKVLMNILKENQNTLFGKKHKFSNIDSIEDFQELMPVSNYEDLEPYISSSLQGEKNTIVKNQPPFLRYY